MMMSCVAFFREAKTVCDDESFVTARKTKVIIR